MNDITCHGTDGSVWRFHAVHGDEFTPQETGWVLLVEGSSPPIEPQAISAMDVLGDLKSMMPHNEAAPVMVRMKAEEMLKTLEERRDRDPAAAADRSLTAGIAALERELEAVGGAL